jgi:CO/xanthine dehydrogenase Mo-binding subunit
MDEQGILVAAGVSGSSAPERVITFPEAVALCLTVSAPIAVLGTFYGPRGKEVHRHLASDRIFPDFTFGTHLADVEVDCDTGAVKILRYIASHDIGRAINPQSVQGQIAGGAAQGIGFALMERVVFDRGANLTTGFFQYQIPTSLDLPDIECVVLESGEGLGPFGARGIGEPPIGPCAAAIASAIEDATGVRPSELPMTPERVLSGLS